MESNRLHYYDHATCNYLSSHNRKVFLQIDKKKYNFLLPFTLLDIFSFSRLLSRLFRLDRINILRFDKDYILMLRQKNVILHDLKLKESRIVFKLKKTRNILFGSSVDREDTILFGDYGGNNRSKIYKSSDNGKSWDIIFEFGYKEIKQILNIKWDKYEKKYWVFTGDERGECGFFIFNEQFEKLDKHYDGTLQYRAISVFFFAECVIWITNDPYDGSKVYRYDRLTREIIMLGSFLDSVWYSKRTNDGLIFIASVVEKVGFTRDNLVKIYSSYDFNNWSQEATFIKDSLPMKLFRYGVASFPEGDYSSQDMFINLEGVKNYDGKIIKLKI